MGAHRPHGPGPYGPAYAHDRLEPLRLMTLPERPIGARRIEDFCSAIELRRHLLRFLREFPRMHTLSGARRTRLNRL